MKIIIVLGDGSTLSLNCWLLMFLRMNYMLIKFSSSFSGKLKVVEIQCLLFLLRPPGFSNPVKELFSWHSGKVVDLPNSCLISRELLRNHCSYTIVTVWNVVPQIFQIRICHLMILLVPLVRSSETRCSDFRDFSVREKQKCYECNIRPEVHIDGK